jgi:hypothetical protein
MRRPDNDSAIECVSRTDDRAAPLVVMVFSARLLGLKSNLILVARR